MGVLTALTKRDFWQARPRLTLTYHIIGEKKQVSGAVGLAALAKKDYWQARPRLTLTYHVILVFKQVSGISALAKKDSW